MKPFFIKSISGNIFGLYHSPPAHIPVKKNILFIPPFAEELNRSRHMVNRQARRFVKAGYGVLILDLFGTGDSEGGFGETSIEIWQKDILAAINWLNEQSDVRPILWAMRSGALLVADLIQKYPELTKQLVLWSPVTNGKKFISQFMRIKLAAGVTSKTHGQQATLKDLWAMLDSGTALEIAGYSLSPELAHGMAGLDLNNVKLPQSISVKWIEISLGDPASPSPASQKIIKYWMNDNVDVSSSVVNDFAFWTLQEPEWANKYIDQTTAYLTE